MSDEKWRPFNCFSVQETSGSLTGPDLEKGWVIKTLEAQVGQFLLGCKCLVSWGIVMQEQDHFGDLPKAFSLQNVLQLHQQRSVILHVESLGLWKIINEDAVFVPLNRGKNFPIRYLHSEFFGVG